jgi:hypothetical protein
MQQVRSRFGSNVIVGLFLLVMLAVFAGPSTLPRVLSDVFPGFYEGVPCQWLKTAEDRANHQSLLGRGATNPISLSVQTTALPSAADASGVWLVRIIIANNSLGTVPFVYDPNAIIVGDNGTSGLGLIFTPSNSLSISSRQDYGQNIPENLIRLLGPRQRCVHTIEFAAGNVLIDPAVTSGGAQVRSFYRNNSSGAVVQSAGAVATPIYNDMGLWTGLVESGNAVLNASTP